MKKLVIIPAYNEADHIVEVVEKVKQCCPSYDCLVVNDGSADQTQAKLLGAGLDHVTLPVNLGIGGAVQTGYLYARENDYDIAIQLDGDGQHDPAYLDALIEPILRGRADVTIGSRFIKKEGFQTSLSRRMGINILGGVIKVCCGYTATDATSGFRAASKTAIAFYADHYAHDYPEPEAIVSGVLRGLRIKEVPVTMNERQGGKSSISGLKSAYYMVKVSLSLLLCRFSYKRMKGK